MLRAIIIDDEPAHRMGIARHVHWKELGYEQPLQAQDAEDAIRMIVEQGIRIVITDICMPGMNGIEMIHKLNSMVENMNIIIISGFDEFEFARQSIEEGARTYLLKPVKIEEVEKWLMVFKEETFLRESIEKEDLKVRNSLKFSIDIARGKYLESLLTTYPVEKEYVLNMTKALDLPLGKFHCVLATLTVCDYFNLMSRDYEEGAVLQERIRSAVDLMLAKEEAVLFTALKPNRMAVVICGGNGEWEVERYTQLFDLMCKTLLKEAGIHIGVILNRGRLSWEDIHPFYRKSVAYLNQLGNMDSGYVFWANKNEEQEQNIRPLYDADELMKAISTEDVPAILALSDSIFVNSAEMPFESLQALVMRIAGELIRLMTKANKMNNNMSLDLWRDLLLAEQPARLNKTFSDLVSEYIGGLVEKQKSSKHYIVERVEKYIQENYQTDIAVQTLAEHLNINQSYLSVLFKKEIGQNISSYLSEIRISKAKQYLQNPDIKIQDITTLVGYQTHSYFTYQFKKHVGCTPAEFRERKL